MKRHTRTSLAGIALAIMTVVSGCATTAPDEAMGTVDMELQIAPGVSVNTVNWTISNATTGFSRMGSATVRFSNLISFQSGGIPPGEGYTITLTATSTDNQFSCSGSANFSITAGMTTGVSVQLNCSTPAAGQGTVTIIGTTQICANLDSLSASPLETAVDTAINLSATGSAGTVPVSFSWTATAGTFDNAASANPVFTCPSTPGQVTITVTISPGSSTCNTITTQSVTVTCDTLAPTFTNVYATILSQRCFGCHRPGGGGVTVGMLDMSTATAAYANLVNVNAAGTGAGTSGITCASVTPPLVRVIPNDSANSLLYNKVHSKQIGALAACGSPMPLPAAAASLTPAQVNLIAAWIDAGAMNN